MRQDEQADRGFLCDLRGLPRRRVPVPVRLLLQGRVRRRVVDQDVRAPGDRDEVLVGHRVPCVDDLAAAARRAQDVLRADRAIPDPDRLAFLQPAEQGTRRDAERLRPLHTEPPGPRPLLEHVAQARDRVDRLVGGDRVLAAVHGPARRDLLRLHREAWREVAEGEQLADEPLHAPRPVDFEGRPPTVHRHALDHPGQPEEMVSVEVGQEDPRHLHEAQAALHELPLRAFPAVEQHDLRPAFHRHSAHVPLRRRPRSGRTEEHDLHGPVSRRATGA